MESFALYSPYPTITSSFSPSSRISLHLRSRPSSLSKSHHSYISPKPTLRSSLSSAYPSLSLSNPTITSSSILSQNPPKPSNQSKPLRLSPPTTTTTTTKPNPQGAKIVPLVISLAVGLIVRFFVPKPPEVLPQAWQLLAIFLSTIAGHVLSPLPVGAWAFWDSPHRF
ncbi:hypothetical protein LOK49_LG12G00318 [Camellia lanceoleosa]|uniref:Uncharacterized protein n=1 Tax=Camellia lanceoleosa TaxID=1840588 RepID=A0ACC0FSQ7_9ERIC|nr:hypothetical protein LOK49_LG12G00318 [Camellia lanceoleosa]